MKFARVLRQLIAQIACLLVVTKIYDTVEIGVNALRLIQMDSFMLKTDKDWFNCDFLLAQHIVRCYDFYEHKPQFNLSLNKFKEMYPQTVQFNYEKIEEIEVGGLKWSHSRFKFKAEHAGRSLTLDEKQFYGLYAKVNNVPQFHDYFNGKGIIKTVAVCSFDPEAGQKNLGRYVCQMPWYGVKVFSLNEFFEVFHNTVTNEKHKPISHCLSTNKNFNYVEYFIDFEGVYWKCWNGFAWKYDIPKPNDEDVLSLDQFENVVGNLNQILESFPKNGRLLGCQYVQKESKILKKLVFECDEGNPQRAPFWPDYTDKIIQWRWTHEMQNSIVHPDGDDHITFRIVNDRDSVEDLTRQKLDELVQLALSDI